MSGRKGYTATQKVKILREHLENQVPVSELCKRYDIQPTVFYSWKKLLFEGALEIFSGSHKNRKNATERKNVQLNSKLSSMHEVITELSAENLKLRKNEFGEI